MRKREKKSIVSQPLEAEVYGSDAPASDPKQDRFGRFPFAQRVALTLARREDPKSIVIAIHGAWGEGKTTVLAYIDLELRGFHPEVVCVRFNPWRFTDEGTLLKSFFDTVADGLKRSLTTGKERIGKVLRDYGKLASVSIEYQGAKVSVGEGVQQLGASWSTASVEDKKRKVEAVLREEGRRIVVLIDDIDRLERSEIRQIFKLVKLTADFEYTSYVLAFDPEMVAGALGETYGSGTTKDGSNFLEKIVQVPLNLPAADTADLQEYCFDHVNEALRVAQIRLADESRQEFEAKFDRYFASALNTPRAAKRYANALAFVMPLLAGEVNLSDVMILEALRVFYPALHAEILRSPERFVGDSRPRSQDDHQRAKDWMQTFLSESPVAEPLFKQLFPMVRGVLRDGKFGTGDEVEWSRQQRVASGEYLRRYLSCSVPRSDISDRAIEQLIVELNGLSDGQALDRFLAFIADVEPRRLLWKFLWKLRVRAEQMDGRLAGRLALILARSGNAIPGPTDKDPLFSAQSSAAFLIRTLLARIEEPSDRLVAAREVLGVAMPLTFAHLCWQSMRSQRDGPDFLVRGDINDLEILLADRIADFGGKESLWKTFHGGIDWLILLFHWQRNRGSEAVRAYYRRALEADVQESVALVRFQLGLYTSGPFTNDFQVEHYKSLALLADPEDVFRALRKVDSSRITTHDAKLIRQFETLREEQQKSAS